MSSKETDLKEKFRVALNSTAKVIADDFEVNRKNQENKKKELMKNTEKLENPIKKYENQEKTRKQEHPIKKKS